MDEMEDMMAGLFGDLSAPAAEDPRRRGDFAGGSVGGPSVFLQRLMPYLMGAPGIIRGGRFGPQPEMQGLQRLLAQASMNPGIGGVQTSINPVGGPNVAPGNIDSGAANYQSGTAERGQGPGVGSLDPGDPGAFGARTRPAGMSSLPSVRAAFGGR